MAQSLSYVSSAASLFGDVASISSDICSFNAQMERRKEDWKNQISMAEKELGQIDAQIEAANTRLEIAKKERDNHKRQIKMAEEIDRVMRSKYTNLQLYDWMVTQTSSVYFQAYQLAYDLAKRAERAYQFELCVTGSSFVQFESWDSLKKGLLSGERLRFQLQRMDAAYLENNKREYEVTKHISLKALNGLGELKEENGLCEVELTEVLF
ncbi:MAG: hypothetical protein ACFFKA_01500, partial [Candidatus Thorarchaeota archaeon]